MLDDLAKLNAMMGKQQKEEELARARAEGVRFGEERAMNARGVGWDGGGGGGGAGSWGAVGVGGGGGGNGMGIGIGNGSGGGGGGGSPQWYPAPPNYGPGRIDPIDYQPFIPPHQQCMRRRSSAGSIGRHDLTRHLTERVNAVGGRVMRDIERVGERMRGIEHKLESFETEYRRNRSRERQERETYLQFRSIIQDVMTSR